MKLPVQETRAQRRVAELLAQHADELTRGESPDLEKFVRRAPGAEGELRPLLLLAEGLRRALVPVSPAPTFRQSLREGLYLAAGQRDPHRLILGRIPPPDRGVWMGVAAVGSLVAAGSIVAWVVRSRVRPVVFAGRN